MLSGRRGGLAVETSDLGPEGREFPHYVLRQNT